MLWRELQQARMRRCDLAVALGTEEEEKKKKEKGQLGSKRLCDCFISGVTETTKSVLRLGKWQLRLMARIW